MDKTETSTQCGWELLDQIGDAGPGKMEEELPRKEAPLNKDVLVIPRRNTRVVLKSGFLFVCLPVHNSHSWLSLLDGISGPALGETVAMLI